MKQPLLPWISRMSHQKEPDWVSSLCYSPLIYSLCWCTWNMNGTLSYARCHPLSRIAGASKWCHGCKFWGKHTWRGWYFVLKHYFFFTEEINNVTFFLSFCPLLCFTPFVTPFTTIICNYWRWFALLPALLNDSLTFR